MTERHDGSSIDLEKQLVRYMVERRVTRRDLLELIGKVGAAAALAPVIAACTSAASSSAPASAAASQAAAASATAAPSTAGSAAPTDTPAPTPIPQPEDALNIYNWTEYLSEDAIPSFREAIKEKYGVDIKVTIDYFGNMDEAYAKLGNDGGGYDLSFPISVDIPRLLEKGAIIELDKSLLPNIVNLGAEWSDPLYDPGNAHSIPYMWWTTGIAYDKAKIPETLTSSTALWDQRFAKHIGMLDDWQEVFGMTLIQLGLDPNTTDPAQIDQAYNRLVEQRPLVRVWDTNTRRMMSSGDVWIGQIWGADLYRVQKVVKKAVYYIPEEGGVKGSDTMAVFSGAQHPIAAQLFINHMLDAHVAAENTNYIYYMGPNAAAKEFILPEILDDPTVNPDQATVAKLQELLDLSPEVRDEYLKRWHLLGR
jgi:spermidine/putrescine transport system substrate-binding protein